MIWIADLNRVGIEFLKRFLFRFRAHPVELFDSRAIRSFQIGDEILDLLFCVCSKIFSAVELADSEAHRTERSETVSNKKIAAADRCDRTFPPRLLLLLTGKRFGM